MTVFFQALLIKGGKKAEVGYTESLQFSALFRDVFFMTFSNVWILFCFVC